MQPLFLWKFAVSLKLAVRIICLLLIDRVYPTFCVLQALLHYILCFFLKKLQYMVGKLLKNMWIKFTNAVIAGYMNKY
jgi:hypothetical protein